MSKRDIGQEILEGIREIKAHKAGEKNLRTLCWILRLSIGFYYNYRAIFAVYRVSFNRPLHYF